MPAPATNPYLRTKIMTASPEELRLMLYEGAIKFCRQGRDAIEREDFEASYNALTRAKNIVLELSSSLKADMAPELCQRLSALYTYIFRRLVDASTHREIEPIDEAIGLLDYERETWQMLIRKVADEETGSRSTAGSGSASPSTAANPYAGNSANTPTSRFTHSA